MSYSTLGKYIIVIIHVCSTHKTNGKGSIYFFLAINKDLNHKEGFVYLEEVLPDELFLLLLPEIEVDEGRVLGAQLRVLLLPLDVSDAFKWRILHSRIYSY